MACHHHRMCLSHYVRSSIPSFSSPLLPTRLSLCSRTLASTPIRFSSPSVSATCFTWDDVVRISDSQYSLQFSDDLQGFVEKIRVCNRGLVYISLNACLVAHKTQEKKIKIWAFVLICYAFFSRMGEAVKAVLESITGRFLDIWLKKTEIAKFLFSLCFLVTKQSI